MYFVLASKKVTEKAFETTCWLSRPWGLGLVDPQKRARQGCRFLSGEALVTHPAAASRGFLALGGTMERCGLCPRYRLACVGAQLINSRRSHFCTGSMRSFYSVTGAKAWPLCLWSCTSSHQHPLMVRTVWQNVHSFCSNMENCVRLTEESARSRSRAVGNALTVVVGPGEGKAGLTSGVGDEGVGVGEGAWLWSSEACGHVPT